MQVGGVVFKVGVLDPNVGYYAWLVDLVCEREWSDGYVINKTWSIREKDPKFGYR